MNNSNTEAKTIYIPYLCNHTQKLDALECQTVVWHGETTVSHASKGALA